MSISLSISPTGDLQAFVEPIHEGETGYWLELPEEEGYEALHRLFLQTLYRRGHRAAQRPSAPPMPDMSKVLQWLTDNPPRPQQAKPAVGSGSSGKPTKPTASLADLKGLF